MKAWESVQRSINYMEEHLPNKIEMEELAGIAYLSPFYFQRLFNRLSMTYQIVDENMPLIANGITLEISQHHLYEARFFCGLSTQHPVGYAALSANYSQLAPSTVMNNRRSASVN